MELEAHVVERATVEHPNLLDLTVVLVDELLNLGKIRRPDEDPALLLV
jgi:hypothetical protein